MEKIVSRRVRAELASGIMITEIDTFAVTVYQIEAYTTIRLYKDAD